MGKSVTYLQYHKNRIYHNCHFCGSARRRENYHINRISLRNAGVVHDRAFF